MNNGHGHNDDNSNNNRINSKANSNNRRDWEIGAWSGWLSRRMAYIPTMSFEIQTQKSVTHCIFVECFVVTHDYWHTKFIIN